MCSHQSRKPLDREPYLLRQKPGIRSSKSYQRKTGSTQKPMDGNPSTIPVHKPISPTTDDNAPRPIQEDSDTMGSNGESTTTSVNRTEFLDSIDKIMKKLDDVNFNVMSMRGEIAEIRKTLTEVETSAAATAAGLEKLENIALPKVRKEGEESVNELRDLILAMEVHDRKMNLLLYGVAKSRDECVSNVVRKSFQEIGFSQEEAQNILLAHAHRLPRRLQPGEGRIPTPDPIIVRFALMRDRDAVLLAFQKFQKPDQGTPRPALRIVTDLPPKLKKERYLLEKAAYDIRRNEQKSTRIRLVGTKLRLESREKGAATAWKQVVN